MENSLLNAISQAQEGILSELIDTGLQNSHSQKVKWGLAGDGEVKKCVWWWWWGGNISLKQNKTLGRVSERRARMQQCGDGGSHKYSLCIIC